ncbi:MAG: FAD-dependent oxidoreductase [Deltaproteobacteria bacterium]|nr:FAD-dependent oxidoreductase [Deltaproteobacteria bacterium]MBW2362274.1 FAD-dependent oxidoreductase [Deltaproteobacteria bacterium]
MCAAARNTPFLETSPWLVAPQDRQPALAEDRSADIVIVGGGYTGLSAALSLRDAGADVALLEADFCGFGASGRNAGHLTPTIGKDLPTTLRLFGRPRAAALVRFADAAVEYAEEVIAKHGIACDYTASGNLVAGVHPKHERSLVRAAEAAASLGAQVRYIAPAEMRERGLPPAFLCGVLEERGGTLDPGRYVSGLRAAVLRSGVRVYEDTRVTQLEDGAQVVARGAGGSIRADCAVIATNAYTHALGRRRRHVVPLRVSLFETEPLAAGVLEALGWHGREGVYTAHEVLENYRITAHGTLTGGSKVVRYRYASGFAPGGDPAAFAAIERAFRERFPMLRDLPVAHFWGGWIGLTLDVLPQFGVEGSHANVHFGVGFNGHGIAQGTLMGAMLAQRILGRLHPHAAALERSLRAWPLEPVRWLGSQLINGGLALIDARTDRQVRRLAGRGGGRSRA